ncbi:hypothetical protein FSZ31_08055 [Sphingorhabdus soli]|uniref:Alpha/beta hydrolase n=1 Tax=Flavisphingopyxis soli TaxID=2601267 RepID=A0A5C6U7B0_9SPHN|nr:hypothetical protein [Sphingorhabdus soli]TXC68903.1 hypothetical protein FSZ31_08055 [Sphingorhabdus soli]
MSAPALAEQIVRDGPATGPVVLFVLPLFEEANRLRRTVRLAMRALAEREVGSILPDLPGQNESLVPTHEATLSSWRTALADHVAANGRPILIASIRGGALIDDAAVAAHWRFAPVRGASLLKTMMRTRIAGDREAGRDTSMAELEAKAANEAVRLAGNILSPAMIAELREAEPVAIAPCRSVPLGTGEDALPGRPLWLQAEPGEDAGLAAAIADDITTWMTSCANF